MVKINIMELLHCVLFCSQTSNRIQILQFLENCTISIRIIMCIKKSRFMLCVYYKKSNEKKKKSVNPTKIIIIIKQYD